MNLSKDLLGIRAQSLAWYQIAIRAIIVYLATLLMVRMGLKRFIGKSTAFDFIVGIILGSLVTNAINSPSVSFLGTLIGGFVLVGLHWLFAFVTFKSNRLDSFLKGTSSQLVENGEIKWNAMKKGMLTPQDLTEQMRIVAHTEDLDQIKQAYFERSGDISVIQFHSQPRVLEVKVEKGVQTVRIILDS